MDSSTPEPPAKIVADEALIRTICKQMLRAWNVRSADDFASFFSENGIIVGFDGSVVTGNETICDQLRGLFKKHETPAYVSVIRSVRFLSEDCAIAHGISGMPSVLTGEINPTLNAVQMITFMRHQGIWRVELFHSTPARLYGDPEAFARMTEELQQRLMNSGH